MPRLLVVDGNAAADRVTHVEIFGAVFGQIYGEAIRAVAADVVFDVCFPADADANLPTGAGLADYDGVALTGSTLHLWHNEPESRRQVEFARAVYASRVPFFGSCWGLQVAAVAAGGTVERNPRGREVGFARNIGVTDAGRSHPLLAGRPAAFTAPCVHLDAVTVAPADCTILAANAMAPMQAAEIRHAGGTFWGVQYHPEFDLATLAGILRRSTPSLVAEGFFAHAEAAGQHAGELETLHADRQRHDLAWRHGLDAELLDDQRRLLEIENWLNASVRPAQAARGRD
jgi:GMP synthase (glutamine-hydrolysing)